MPIVTDWPSRLAVVAGGGYLVLLGLAMTRASYDVWGALVVGPLIVVVTIPIVVRLFRDADRWTLGIVIAGLFAKLAAAMLFYWVAFDAYRGASTLGGITRRAA